MATSISTPSSLLPPLPSLSQNLAQTPITPPPIPIPGQPSVPPTGQSAGSLTPLNPSTITSGINGASTSAAPSITSQNASTSSANIGTPSTLSAGINQQNQTQQGTQPPTGNIAGVNSPAENPGALGQAMLAIQNEITQNNALVAQKNLMIQQLYGTPLSDAQKAQLDPQIAATLNSGDRNLIDFNLRLLNDQIAGRTNTLDQSVQYLGTQYDTQQQQIQSNYNDAITNVLNYARANGQAPSAVMKALYPQYASTLGPALDSIAAPSGEYIGVNNQPIGEGSVTIPSGTLASINNNPGDLKFVGQTGATQGQGGFAAFSSPEAGYQALVDDVAMKMNGQSTNPIPDGPDQGQPLEPTSTLEDLIRVFAPTADGNNPVSYAAQIAQALGVSSDTPLSELNATQVAEQIADHESGTTFNATSTAPPLLIPSQRSAVQAANTAINNGNIGKAFQNATNAYGAISGIDPTTTNPAEQQQALMNLAQLEFPGTNSARGLLTVNPADAQDSGFATALLNAQRILQQTGALQPGVIAQLQAQATQIYNNTKKSYDSTFQANVKSLSSILGKPESVASQYLTNLDASTAGASGASGPSGASGTGSTSGTTSSGISYTIQ